MLSHTMMLVALLQTPQADVSPSDDATHAEDVKAEEVKAEVREASESPRPLKRVGHWRATMSLGGQQMTADSVNWFGESGRPEFNLAVERNFGDLLPVIPGVGARLGLAVTARNRDIVSLTLTELEVGLSYQFPHDGFADWLFPYGRVDFLAGWSHIEAVSSLQHDAFVPGLGLMVGARAHLPRFSARLRLFGYVEGGLQLRASYVPRLYEPADEPLPGPATPLGNVDPTSYAIRLGLGVEI